MKAYERILSLLVDSKELWLSSWASRAQRMLLLHFRGETHHRRLVAEFIGEGESLYYKERDALSKQSQHMVFSKEHCLSLSDEYELLGHLLVGCPREEVPDEASAKELCDLLFVSRSTWSWSWSRPTIATTT